MGTPAEDAMLPFQLNGNKVREVRLGGADALTAANLIPGTHYNVSGPNVTIKAAWTRSYLSANSSAGIKTPLTVVFDKGAPLEVSLVQYAPPVLANNNVSLSASIGADGGIAVPITWNGIPKPAAVRGMTIDGKALVDEWTQWLGPLQRFYLTYQNHWNWNATHFFVTAGGVQAVRQANGTAVWRIEVWPRVEGNAVDLTIVA